MKSESIVFSLTILNKDSKELNNQESTHLECAKACWLSVQGPWMTSERVLNTWLATPIALKKFTLPAGSISSLLE